MLESGDSKGALEYIKKDYDVYLGGVFEEIVKEAFIKWCITNRITWDRIGRWWFKDMEIDLVGLSATRDELLCGEIKWTKKQVKKKLVGQLIEKSEQIRWGSPKRKERFIIISRGGFSADCKQMMESENIFHWTLEELSGIFWDKNDR